jgi:hypothetical protein
VSLPALALTALIPAPSQAQAPGTTFESKLPFAVCRDMENDGERLLQCGWRIGETPGGPVPIRAGTVWSVGYLGEGPLTAQRLREIAGELKRNNAPGLLLDAEIIGDASVDGDGLAALADVPSLRALTIRGMSMRDKELGQLLAATQLEFLYIDSAKATGSGFASIAALGSLVKLDLVNTPVRDEALASIAKLPKLRRLKLVDTRVGDAGLAHLRGHPTLERLVLYQKRITNKVFPILDTLPKLRMVGLDGTSVTRAAVRTFRRAHPGVEIEQ